MYQYYLMINIVTLNEKEQFLNKQKYKYSYKSTFHTDKISHFFIHMKIIIIVQKTTILHSTVQVFNISFFLNEDI